MIYTLITRNGTVSQYYILECAECFRSIYGGVIISEDIEQVIMATEEVKILEG
jgi:hypothetical protein